MNHPFQFGAHLIDNGPKPLLDLEAMPLKRRVEFRILAADQIAMGGFDQRNLMLEGSL
jgi:hypothetical protein